MTTTWQIVAVIIVLTVLVEVLRNPKLRGKLRGGSEKLGLSDPKILITIGIVVFNLISWAMIPWWWSVLTYTWYGFLIFNLGFWVVLYLRTVKIKDKDGKDTKENNLTASKMASIIALVLVVGLATTTWSLINTKWKNDGSSILNRTPAGVSMSHSVPMEVALRIIAECESGSKQFGPDGKPLRNKEGSSAIGKYQILASDHEERAKKMGFDIKTEEGNEAYARVLYAESGTKHWEVDPRSSICWEPKLRAYTWGGEVVSLVVKAPVGNVWSDIIPLPRNGGYHSLDGFGKKYIARWNNGRPDQTDEELPRLEGVQKKKPAIVYDFCLKSREPEAVPITVKFF